MHNLTRITFNPEIMGGKPCIRGMRVTVGAIVGLIASGKTVAEVLADPQVKHLDLVEELVHPQAGRLKFVGAPVRYDGLAQGKSAPPPLLGEQTAAILKQLGYDQAAIDELVARGVTKVDKS